MQEDNIYKEEIEKLRLLKEQLSNAGIESLQTHFSKYKKGGKLTPETKKIERDAFLYLEPGLYRKDFYGSEKEFAQCSTCPMWTGKHHNTCTIHGKNIKVTGDMTCYLYVNGQPMPEMAGKEHKNVIPEESGLIRRPVRCENCKSFDNGVCRLFQFLNIAAPNLFDMDINVKWAGCCNANKPIEKEE